MAFSSAVLDLKKFSEKQILSLFEKASKIEKENLRVPSDVAPAALVFLEPSTRTRLSFQMACARLGLAQVTLSGKKDSSLEKGETEEDTLLNILAMRPSVIVVRSGNQLPMLELAEQDSIPWINAGWGIHGHPTQALLDALSLKKFRGSLRGEKMLLVGDIRHSRVVASHIELSRVLGYEIGFCGPDEFLPKSNQTHIQLFHNLSEGLRWATAAMALRVQLERHENSWSFEDYHQLWGLNSRSLREFRSDGIVMHPGPVQAGVEIATSVFQDSRCRILQQVTQGVYLRQALLHTLLVSPEELK